MQSLYLVQILLRTLAAVKMGVQWDLIPAVICPAIPHMLWLALILVSLWKSLPSFNSLHFPGLQEIKATILAFGWGAQGRNPNIKFLKQDLLLCYQDFQAKLLPVTWQKVFDFILSLKLNCPRWPSPRKGQSLLKEMSCCT